MLTYNVTLLGPARGAPVLLQLAGGVSLVRGSSSSSGSSSGGGGAVTCQLVRLWVSGFGPVVAAPLATSAQELLALGWGGSSGNSSSSPAAGRRALRQQQQSQSSAAVTGGGVDAWRDRCVTSACGLALALRATTPHCE